MKIEAPYTSTKGVKFGLEYHDADSFANLEYEHCRQVYGVCFCGDHLIIGFGGEKANWGLIGGTIEKGETFEETLKREIQEESNTDVVSALPVGYQKVTNSETGTFIYQLRYVCRVEKIGDFVSDPTGGVTEIKLIDPSEYKRYFDWGRIGDRIMERSLELKSKLP